MLLVLQTELMKYIIGLFLSSVNSNICVGKYGVVLHISTQISVFNRQIIIFNVCLLVPSSDVPFSQRDHSPP